MDWIEALKRDENETLKKIYTTCRGELISWLKGQFNCDTEESLDIFQASVIILYDNVITGKLQSLDSGIKNYLKGIARNKALELLRSKKQRQNLNENIWFLYMYPAEANQSLEYQLNIASEALNTIGDPCKSLLRYFYYDQKSMEEITVTMGYKNSDTTKNQKYKCLKRLQSIYFEHLHKNAGQ